MVNNPHRYSHFNHKQQSHKQGFSNIEHSNLTGPHKAFKTQSDRLASIKPRQRQLSPEELKALMVRKQLAQLSALSGIRSQQDLLQAYQALTEMPHVPGSHDKPKNTIPSRSLSGRNPLSRQETSIRHPGSHLRRDQHSAIEQNKKKTISEQNAMDTSNSLVAQVKAREEALIKQQNEFLLRRKRQMLEEAKNKMKLLEYARLKEQEALIRDIKMKYSTLANTKLEQYLQKEKLAKRTSDSSPNEEYMKAFAAYQSLYAGQAQAALLGRTSPPFAPSLLQKNHAPSIPRSSSSIIHSSNSKSPPINTSPSTIKRPATSTHSDVPTPKKQSPYPLPQTSTVGLTAADEIKNLQAEQALKLGLFQAMMANAHQDNSSFTAEKRLSSMPVKDRLELARRKAAVGHQEAMSGVQRAKLMQKGGLCYARPETTTLSPTNNGQVTRKPEGASGEQAKMILQNNLAKQIASNAISAKLTSPQTTSPSERLRNLTTRASIEAVSSKSPSGLQVQQASTRERRLPSYDDAIAAQRTVAEKKKQNNPEAITPDVISSVAKRLVTSSQEWLKMYMNRDKDLQAKSDNETVVDIVMNGKGVPMRIQRDIPKSSPTIEPPFSKAPAISPKITSNKPSPTEAKTDRPPAQRIVDIPEALGLVRVNRTKAECDLAKEEMISSQTTIFGQRVLLDPKTGFLIEEKKGQTTLLPKTTQLPSVAIGSEDSISTASLTKKTQMEFSTGMTLSDVPSSSLPTAAPTTTLKSDSSLHEEHTYIEPPYFDPRKSSTHAMRRSRVSKNFPDINPPPVAESKISTIPIKNEPLSPVEQISKESTNEENEKKCMKKDETEGKAEEKNIKEEKEEGRQSENDLMQADAATLGKEERALQRAIIRFNDMEKELSEEPKQKSKSEKAEVKTIVKRPNGVLKRKKRKLSKFRKRICNLRNTTSPSGQLREPLSGRRRGRPRFGGPPRPPSQKTIVRKFQDFVPTVLNHRTRNSGLDRVQNYRSMYDARNIRYELEVEKERVKVQERRRRSRVYVHTENMPAPESKEADEEVCLPPPSKKTRGRPRKLVVHNQDGGATNVTSESLETLVSGIQKQADEKALDGQKTPVSPSHPLRVVLDENSQTNHIKMKFVKVGGAGDIEKALKDETAWDATRAENACPDEALRRRLSQPKVGRKRKVKSKHVEVEPPSSPQPPKLEMITPREERKENESDFEEFVQDPDLDGNDPEKLAPEYTQVMRPEPPAVLKKSILNKNLGETHLHRAATIGSMEMASYCVDYRVIDINARDNAGYTALHESCVNGHLNVAQYLLSHGAEVNASAADGTRPIHDAVDNDRVELVRLLLAYGADPLLPTYNGRTTTRLALRRSGEMKTLLFGYLQDVNGDRSKLEDSPPHPLDYQWSFNGSSSLFDADKDSETYIFADVPGPEGAFGDNKSQWDENANGIYFEISEEPLLPSFNLRLDGHDKFRNWVLLDQFLERVSMSREKMEAAFPHLDPITLPADQFHQSVQESQVSTATMTRSCDVSEVKGDMVTLVELDDRLRNILGVDVDYVG